MKGIRLIFGILVENKQEGSVQPSVGWLECAAPPNHQHQQTAKATISALEPPAAGCARTLP